LFLLLNILFHIIILQCSTLFRRFGLYVRGMTTILFIQQGRAKHILCPNTKYQMTVTYYWISYFVFWTLVVWWQAIINRILCTRRTYLLLFT